MAGRPTALLRAVLALTTATLASLALAAPAPAARIGQTGGADTVFCTTQLTWADTTYAVPSGGGTITRFAFESAADNAGQQLDFLVLRPAGGSNYTVVGKTGLVTLAGTGAVETFPANIPVQENDILGFWLSGPEFHHCADNTDGSGEIFGDFSNPTPDPSAGASVSMPNGPFEAHLNLSACLDVLCPAAAAYYPSGPQTFVKKGQLDGWERCFSGLYTGSKSLDTILTRCDGDPLLLAGGPTGSSTLTVLAAAPRADVLFDTGTSDDPHNANGSGWYYSSSYSWGFAKEGDAIHRLTCDDMELHADLRLCWHTASGFLTPGYRAGAVRALNEPFGKDYTRYIYEAVADLALSVEPQKRRVEVGENAKFEATVENVGIRDASDVEVCVKAKRANAALESTNQCKAVGALITDAQTTKSFNLKAKPKAAGDRFALKFTAVGAGLDTVARRAKVIVKP